MKTLKTNAITHHKVKKIFELMRELNIEIEYLGGEFRVTDLELGEKFNILKNLCVIDIEYQPVTCLPPVQECLLRIYE